MKPTRERPRAFLSIALIPAAGRWRARMMAGSIQCIVSSPASLSARGVRHQVPEAHLVQTSISSKNRIPRVAVSRKIAPRGSGARDPDDRIRRHPIVARRTAVIRLVFHDKGREERLLLIRQAIPNQSWKPAKTTQRRFLEVSSCSLQRAAMNDASRKLEIQFVDVPQATER